MLSVLVSKGKTHFLKQFFNGSHKEENNKEEMSFVIGH